MLEELEKLVNDFIAKLKQQLVQPWTGPVKQRGIGDRLKNWWANLTKGRYNQSNPYFWQNKLGDDLGSTAESVSVTLEHYKFIDEQALMLEDALPEGLGNLQIVKIIDSWGAQFKAGIRNLFQQYQDPAKPEPTASPVPKKPNDFRNQKSKIPPDIADDDEVRPDTEPASSVDSNFFKKQPTTGKPWNDLSPHEQVAWDEWGGGSAKDVTILCRKAGICSLPWILRIGDPRLKAIRDLRLDGILEKLTRQKRIENPFDMIKNEKDLASAVDNAKKIHASEQPVKPKTEPKPTEQEPEKPITAKMDLPPVKDDTSDKLEELKQELEKLKPLIKQSDYEKIYGQLDNGSPKLVDKAEARIRVLKKVHEDSIDQGSGDGIDMPESVISNCARTLIERFKQQAVS